MPAAPRFRLWHARGSRSVRVLWMFEELGLRRGADYELATMRFPPRTHEPSFLQKNVLGTVPWLEHQEATDAAPRAAMSESCGACLYLSSLFDGNLALQPSDHGYAAFLNWIFHADATLTFPQSIVMRYGIFERGRADVAVEDYSKWYHARLRLLNAALDDGREFLCADRFTLADICVGFALHNASEDGLCGTGLRAHGVTPLSSRHKPAVAAYLARLVQRPAWHRVQEIDADESETT